MYTRNYAKSPRKYTPPPGYDGNAFPEDTPSVKYHEAEDDLPRRPPNTEDVPEAVTDETFDLFAESMPAGETIPVSAQPSPFEEGFRSLESLFRHLRGRFGREELILVLVMLLISSDASIELLLLALLLAVR